MRSVFGSRTCWGKGGIKVRGVKGQAGQVQVEGGLFSVFGKCGIRDVVCASMRLPLHPESKQ